MKSHLVVALTHAPVSIFELSCVMEIFARDRPELGVPWYSFAVATETPGMMETLGGVSIHVENGLEILERADTIVVTSWDAIIPASEPLLGALRAAAERGVRLLSICSGAFLLAEAGILDGRVAATHWLRAAELQNRFPNVAVDPDVLYVDTGQIVTAAGSAAGLDMLLHVVRRDHGPEVCNLVARRLNIPPYRDGGQSQFAVRPVPPMEETRLSRVIAWMRDHSTEDLTIDMLAARAAMSSRTFFRRFREATGQTPYEWLVHERIAIARDMLEAGTLTIDQIAYSAGFGSAETLRCHFKRIVGTTPTEYRKKFGQRIVDFPEMSEAA